MVIALLIASDFSPVAVTDISTLGPSTERIEMICTLAGSSATSKGFMLVLEDSRGQQVKGFAAADLAPLPEPSSLLRVYADLSWDEGLFLYVKKIERIA
ncbi:MAG TPA: hypothetical protein VMB46_02370 [Methanomassiliicoccales archaeon]|nr:hypothetical protein [Methanomassiliicoccales archaeon]